MNKHKDKKSLWDIYVNKITKTLNKQNYVFDFSYLLRLPR